MRAWWRSLRVTYLTVDPRSLGAFRIAFGLVLFSDLFRRWVDLRFWYTNSGLLPNHTLLWRPPSEHSFSLFCLLTYEVYLVSDRSPAPGALPWPTPVGRERFMSYRAPSRGTCQPVSSENTEHPVAAR